MYISENKLRNLIRKELLNEGYTPLEIFEPVLYGYNKKSAVKAEFLGGTGKTGIYVKIPGLKPTGYKPSSNKSNILNDMLKKVKQTKRGKTINQNGINKLKQALANGEIFFSPGNSRIFQVLSDDEKQGIVSFMKDSGIEAGAAISGVAAGAFAAAGMLPIAASIEAIGNGFNILDLFVKLDKKDYVGAGFAVLGLIPGGDTIGLLNKIGALEDTFPASLADDIGKSIIEVLDGDLKNTVTDIVNSYVEDRDLNPNAVNPFVGQILKSIETVGMGFLKIAKKGDVKIKKA
jgi:hypothetical protein